MRRYRVTLNTTCEMVVEVVGASEAEAKRAARQGEYDPVTEWAPLDYNKLRAVSAEPRAMPSNPPADFVIYENERS